MLESDSEVERDNFQRNQFYHNHLPSTIHLDTSTLNINHKHTTQSSMIGLKGRLSVIDNSGALIAECINVLKVKTRKKSTGFAGVGAFFDFLPGRQVWAGWCCGARRGHAFGPRCCGD
jgi:hypothetical protein